MPRVLLVLASLLLLLGQVRASEPGEEWMAELGALPIQEGGRVMPLDSYARGLAAQLTGRETWPAASETDAPAAYAGRKPMQLLCDLLFRPMDIVAKPLITIENRAFKTRVGLDPERRFFSPTELTECKGIESVLLAYEQAKAKNSNATPTREQRIAVDLQAAIQRLSGFVDGKPLPLVPVRGQREFLRAGPKGGDPSTETVSRAFAAFGDAYVQGSSFNSRLRELCDAVQRASSLEEADAKSVRLELLYNRHRPWRMATYGYTLSLALFGLSRLVWRRGLVVAAIAAALYGVVEHGLGVGLRIAILGRAPVSNTYEALLWMGLVGIVIGLVGQIVNRRAWYLFAGIAVALLSVVFSGLVPLESRTTALPAVLRSNYWLIIHVLTIVASYGVLAVASLLGHVYLWKEIVIARGLDNGVVTARLSHPLIVQTYRAIQIGLFLLTAGTILGGVWAADSWGRFWGWDPKETWALISILVYFAILHARYVRWLRDFGLAAAAVVAFAVIVWTFYGVNYLMASGLHSYGFGSGGGTWVAAWAVAEIVFVTLARVRLMSLRLRERAEHAAATKSDAASVKSPKATVDG